MTADSRSMLKRYWRLGLSIILLGHLAAVVAPPLAFQASGALGASSMVNTVLRPVEGYGQFLYIDRGYAFFAPDPGPSHLIQAAITSPSGETSEQMFPDRDVQWPRLLYHRHFMITEFLEEIYQPPGPPRELLDVDREEAEYWVRARARYEHVRQSVVNHLQHENPGQRIAIRRIEHRVPDLLDYQREPIELTDERMYRVLLDQPLALTTPGELSAPTAPPESIPVPSGAIPDAGTETDPRGGPAGTEQPSPADQRDEQATPEKVEETSGVKEESKQEQPATKSDQSEGENKNKKSSDEPAKEESSPVKQEADQSTTPPEQPTAESAGEAEETP